MYIPECGCNIQYKYTSSFITLNLILTVSTMEPGCKLVSLDAPFMGKYYAIIYEDESIISLIKYGKGLFYGSLGAQDLSNPLFKVEKNKVLNEEIMVKGKYIVKMYPDLYNFDGDGVKYHNCRVISFAHEKGYYYIYLKDGEGILAIQNYINNVIKETIVKIG